jgi:hypothetical protein
VPVHRGAHDRPIHTGRPRFDTWPTVAVIPSIADLVAWALTRARHRTPPLIVRTVLLSSARDRIDTRARTVVFTFASVMEPWLQPGASLVTEPGIEH